MAKKLQHFPTS